MDTPDHPLRSLLRERPVSAFLLALMAIATVAAIGWILYAGCQWLVIIVSEALLGYAVVTTLSRLAPPPGGTLPARSFDH